MPLTPAGLPFRIPQASLNPGLRADRPRNPDGTDGAEGREGSAATDRPGLPPDTRRSPEEVRRLVGSYLSGTSRGRSEAARRRPPTGRPAEDTADSTDDESQP
jgi:hypothetical protein